MRISFQDPVRERVGNISGLYKVTSTDHGFYGQGVRFHCLRVRRSFCDTLRRLADARHSGGTSGCVVAARLAENADFKVLLLEAGRDSKDVATVKMSGAWAQNFGGDDDWNIWSEPGAGINGRQIQCSRGRFLGGSSNVNGTLCIRGPKQDYDDWNMEGWSGNEMYKYMAKSEDFHTKKWFQANEDAHGYGGPLHTEPHDLAPISKLVLQSYQDAGLPLHPDMFTTGETPNGCGHAMRTIYEGNRSVAADFVADRSKRPNLDIQFNATVDRIVFERTAQAEPRARSVEVLLKDGTRKSFSARKEIVVSGGAYCSPAILQRSGIGAKADLEKLGIDVVKDLPGVGENLLDHVLVGTCYEVNDTSLTYDQDIYPEGALAKAFDAYGKDRSGVLSIFPFGAFAYTRLDERLADSPLWKRQSDERDAIGLTKDQPNIEYWNTECYGGPPNWKDFPMEGKAAFFMITLLLNGQSQGTVKLKSKDPTQNPIVDHKYLEHPLDSLVLAEGTRFANEIVMKGDATRNVIKGAWPENLTHHKMDDREAWVEYVRNNVVTCKILPSYFSISR